MKLKQKKGFTLVELMMVVAIIGIIAGISTISSRDLRARFRLKGATLDLYSDLQMARLGAIRSGRIWNVCFLPGDKAFTGYNINNDAAGADDAFCTADDVAAAGPVAFRKNVDLSAQSDILYEENFSGTNVIFDPRGSARPAGNVELRSRSATLTTYQMITVNGMTGNVRIDAFNLP